MPLFEIASIVYMAAGLMILRSQVRINTETDRRLIDLESRPVIVPSMRLRDAPGEIIMYRDYLRYHAGESMSFYFIDRRHEEAHDLRADLIGKRVSMSAPETFSICEAKEKYHYLIPLLHDDKTLVRLL